MVEKHFFCHASNITRYYLYETINPHRQQGRGVMEALKQHFQNFSQLIKKPIHENHATKKKTRATDDEATTYIANCVFREYGQQAFFMIRLMLRQSKATASAKKLFPTHNTGIYTYIVNPQHFCNNFTLPSKLYSYICRFIFSHMHVLVVFSHSMQYTQVSRSKGQLVVVSAVVKLTKELAQCSRIATNITFDCMTSGNKDLEMEKPTRIKIVAKCFLFFYIQF